MITDAYIAAEIAREGGDTTARIKPQSEQLVVDWVVT